jgi:single-strand DNA-binding protein
MNNFNFTGRLGSDAEVRHTPSGAAVCNFSVAVDSGYGDNKKSTWIRCAIWGKRAESKLPGFLLKGQQVGICGELSGREFDHNGVTKMSIEVNVSDVTLLGDAPNQKPPQTPAAPLTGLPNDFSDDIPF